MVPANIDRPVIAVGDSGYPAAILTDGERLDGQEQYVDEPEPDALKQRAHGIWFWQRFTAHKMFLSPPNN